MWEQAQAWADFDCVGEESLEAASAAAAGILGKAESRLAEHVLRLQELQQVKDVVH
jgi:hypothetical protein